VCVQPSPAIGRHIALALLRFVNRIGRCVRKAVAESDSSTRYVRPPVLMEQLDSLGTNLAEN